MADIKKSNADIIKKAADKKGYAFVSSGIKSLGDISLSYDTMFNLQRMNPQAQAAKDLIAKMIGKFGVLFEKDGLLHKDPKREKIVRDLFVDANSGSWKTFKDKYYTNYFCSGMVTGGFAVMGDGSYRMQILDSRYIEKSFDDYWNIKGIKYNREDIAVDDTVNQVVKYDPDRPWYGMSIYQTVVYDALSDQEAGKRNYMFFKNGAIPNIILTMDDDLENEDEINAAIDQFETKYKGTDNSHWVLALGGVKEIRTLDVSNRDLELLDLRKFSVKVFGMLFWFDPRFLAFRDDENGSHAEYAKLAVQSDKTMQSYADVLEEFMMQALLKVYPNFNYDGIELINDTFLDDETKLKMYKEEIQNAISTPAEIIRRMGKPTSELPESLNQYYMNIQYNTLDWIIEESGSRSELNRAKAKELWSEQWNSEE